MVKEILPMIPSHDKYVEPFSGGLALFFNKQESNTEVINDVNLNLITFYRVLKNNFQELHKEIDSTLHSEAIHQFTKDIYQNPENYNDVAVAYATWIQCNMSFGNNPLSGFAFRNRGGNRLLSKLNAVKKKFQSDLETPIFSTVTQ